MVQHLGVGEQHVGVAPDPRALLGAGVAVVGGGDQAGDVERGERAELVLGQRLGREDAAARCRAAPGCRRPRRWAPGSRATCPTPCPWPRPPSAGSGEVDGGGLVAPEPLDRQAVAEASAGTGWPARRTVAGRAGRCSRWTRRGSWASDVSRSSRWVAAVIAKGDPRESMSSRGSRRRPGSWPAAAGRRSRCAGRRSVSVGVAPA